MRHAGPTLLLVLWCAGSAAGSAAPSVETLSATRDRMGLDGLWRFEPARGTAAAAPDGDWGAARVPASWDLEGIVARGHGAAWTGCDARTLARAWYERDVTVPARWRDRQIVLRVERVATDARVFGDDVEAGRVFWPEGEVDLTAVLRPGRTVRLRLLVDVAPGATQVFEPGGAERPAAGSFAPATRGLVGGVRLEARPRGPKIGGVFVQTSVRDRRLGLDVDLTDLDGPGPVSFLATVVDAAGRTARRFDGKAELIGGSGQTAKLAWPWPDPALWGPGHPILYTLRLMADGPDLHDEWVERFGFREAGMEDGALRLNGEVLHLRPVPWGAGPVGGGERAGLLAFVRGLAGPEVLLEAEPVDGQQRGVRTFRDQWPDAADEAGLLLAWPLLPLASFIADGDDAGSPLAWANWELRMADEWRRIRNHPSIVLLEAVTSPPGLGRVRAGPPAWRLTSPKGLDPDAVIRGYDATRPVVDRAAGPFRQLMNPQGDWR